MNNDIVPGFDDERVARAIEAGFTRLIFCLDGLNHLSSSGIGAFTHLLKVVTTRSGDLVLLDIQPKVYEVFHLLGFSRYFTIRERLDEALSFLAAGAGRFCCPACTTILALAETGAVNLG
jgi:anti-sigma B factor antagonist